MAHQPAPIDDVYAFENEDGASPDPDNLQFDLSRNHTSLWNTEVLETLLRQLQVRCKDEKWPIERSDNYIREILHDRYKRLRTTWLRAQPKLIRDGVTETPAEVEARMMRYLGELGKSHRQATRRRNVSFHSSLGK